MNRTDFKKKDGVRRGFYPKRSLGQNFLVDPKYRDKIIRACEITSDDIILEIGPGKGMLTSEIARSARQVYAVEKDGHLAAELAKKFKGTNVVVINKDILDFDLNSIPAPFKTVGNLPYNIATPIIEKFIAHRRHCSQLFMTVQLEYGQRLIARPGIKDYSSFSCFVQYYGAAKKLFNIPRTVFYPAPKVQSCFMKLEMLPEPKIKAKDEEKLFRTIRQAFQQRRKTILNSLGNVIEKKKLEKFLKDLKINPMARPEELSLSDYIALTDRL